MADAPASIPMPAVTSDSRPFWDGLRKRQFLVQRCAACGRARHYPRPICPHCHAPDFAWDALPLRGAVHSWAICHQAFHPGFARDVPYTLVLADLAEGVRLYARFRGDASTLRLGMPLAVEFEDMGDELTLPVLAPAPDRG